MKYIATLVVVSIIFATVASAQQRRKEGPPRRGNNQQRRGGYDGGRRQGPPPPHPILDLFDTDKDGELSEKEIENATAVLKKLDKDRDGNLSRDELPRPPRRESRDGRGGRENRDGQQPRGRDGRMNRKSAVNASKGTVVFQDGYETDPQDRGRPVALIAAALGVKTEVFRDAFSNVNPARGGDPTPARARANKKVLMAALGKHGITNERLDEVSNYYRYQPESGNLWRHTPAKATAVIKEGKLVGVKITNAGSGYMTAPTVTVAGYPNVKIKAVITLSKNFKTNGSLASLTIVK